QAHRCGEFRPFCPALRDVLPSSGKRRKVEFDAIGEPTPEMGNFGPQAASQPLAYDADLESRGSLRLQCGISNEERLVREVLDERRLLDSARRADAQIPLATKSHRRCALSRQLISERAAVLQPQPAVQGNPRSQSIPIVHIETLIPSPYV